VQLVCLSSDTHVAQVHQFKGSSASFGARQIAALCVHLREACQAQDRARCQQLLVTVKQQFQVRWSPKHRIEHLDTMAGSPAQGQLRILQGHVFI